MHQSVLESYHLYQRTSECWIKSSLFLHNLEGICIVFGGPETVFCNDVITEVNQFLDSDDKTVFCTPYLMWVARKLRLRKFS